MRWPFDRRGSRFASPRSARAASPRRPERGPASSRWARGARPARRANLREARGAGEEEVDAGDLGHTLVQPRQLGLQLGTAVVGEIVLARQLAGELARVPGE